MTAITTEWCISCDRLRPLEELIEVANVRTSETFYCCSPRGRGPCWRRAVGPRSIHRIRSAVQKSGASDAANPPPGFREKYSQKFKPESIGNPTEPRSDSVRVPRSEKFGVFDPGNPSIPVETPTEAK